MAIGRRFTDDKNEVLASAKISRVVLSRILKLFDFIRAILNIFGISKIRLAKDSFHSTVQRLPDFREIRENLLQRLIQNLP